MYGFHMLQKRSQSSYLISFSEEVFYPRLSMNQFVRVAPAVLLENIEITVVAICPLVVG